MRRTGAVFLVAMVLMAAGCASGPGVTTKGAVEAAPEAAVDGRSDDVIEVDPDTRVLTLDNGLVVYLRSNDRPGRSAEMRLAVNAGSAMEQPDQAGVAHFLEHMLFNGTEQFPGNDLVDVLRGFGMEFGADINAYTTYDETVYELTVPLGDADNMGTGLDVLAQWLSAATIDQAEVTAERGVVLDEWRVSDQTLDGRVGAALDAMFLTGTAYEGRQPIGNEAAIGEMTAEPVRRFYDSWYRPDNAAIVVVGDFDVDEAEQMVRDRFEPLAGRGDPPTRRDLTVLPYHDAAAVVLADPDEVQASVELTYPVPAEPTATVGELRDYVVTVLAFDMIANRLSDDITRGDASLLSAYTSNNDSVRSLNAPSVYTTADEASVNEAVDALVVEFERARRFGFDDNELTRAIEFYRSGLQASYDGRNTRSDSDFAADFVGNFLEHDTIGTAEAEYEAFSTVLDEITVDDVAAALAAHIEASSPHLFITVPQAADGVPAEADLLALLAAAGNRDIEPREAAAAVGEQLMAPPEPVEESDSSSFVDEPGYFLDATRLEFDNGAVVLLNPTDIADGDVAVEASSPGGFSVLPESDVFAAEYGVRVATSSGLGDLDQVAVDTILSGANVGVSPYVDLTSEGFSGNTTADDLELAFQLMHQYIAAPRFEQSALDSAKAQDQPYIDDPSADADFAAYNALMSARYGDTPYYRLVPTQAELDAIDLATAARLYSDRFGSVGDWVFVLSGDFDLDEATDLARRYVGTLDGDGAAEQWQPVEPDPPAGVVTEEVLAGTGDHASLSLLYTVASDGSDYEPLAAAMLNSVIDTRLTDHIREALGASYSPFAAVSVYGEPAATVETSVSVSGDPAGMADLASTVHDDLVDLATNGPSDDEYDAALAALQQQYSYLDNSQIAAMLLNAQRDEGVLDVFLGAYDELGRISQDELADFAARVLPADHYIQVIQRPS
ncbi:MAG: insulinase family protein [Ilumatobacteraceae bacterium]